MRESNTISIVDILVTVLCSVHVVSRLLKLMIQSFDIEKKSVAIFDFALEY